MLSIQPLQGHRLHLKQPADTPLNTRSSRLQRRAAGADEQSVDSSARRGRSDPGLTASQPHSSSSRLYSDIPCGTPSSYNSSSVTPLPGSHPGLKYAQMGHGSFGRGAPHVCYMHDSSSGQGLFYSRALQQEHQHQQQPAAALGWRQLAAHITHTTAALLHGSSGSGRSASGRSSSSSLLAAASAGASGGVPALSATDSTTSAAVDTQQPTTGNPHDDGSSPRWHVLVVQALMLAVLLLVGGSVLKHLLRGGVSLLVACYSGLPFKV